MLGLIDSRGDELVAEIHKGRRQHDDLNGDIRPPAKQQIGAEQVAQRNSDIQFPVVGRVHHLAQDGGGKAVDVGHIGCNGGHVSVRILFQLHKIVAGVVIFRHHLVDGLVDSINNDVLCVGQGHLAGDRPQVKARRHQHGDDGGDHDNEPEPDAGLA